jgi:hypothetical protein
MYRSKNSFVASLSDPEESESSITVFNSFFDRFVIGVWHALMIIILIPDLLNFQSCRRSVQSGNTGEIKRNSTKERQKMSHHVFPWSTTRHHLYFPSEKEIVMTILMLCNGNRHPESLFAKLPKDIVLIILELALSNQIDFENTVWHTPLEMGSFMYDLQTKKKAAITLQGLNDAFSYRFLEFLVCRFFYYIIDSCHADLFRKNE